jgi:hypothetical protein
VEVQHELGVVCFLQQEQAQLFGRRARLLGVDPGGDGFADQVDVEHVGVAEAADHG